MSDAYFDDKVDKAIEEFQKAQTKEEKNKIFVSSIMPAFEKLASYWYTKMPVAKNPEIKQDCLTDLFEKIDKFDTSKKRGFPYFNVIAKNFFYQQLKYEKRQVSNDKYDVSFYDHMTQTGNLDEYVQDDFEDLVENAEFIDIFKKYLVKLSKTAQKEHEKKVVDALIKLFDEANNIDIFNKKAILFYIKEITDLNGKQIAMNLAKIKRKFNKLKKKYQKGDI